MGKKIFCLSDTHCYHREISPPPADIMIFAGDFSKSGTFEQAADFFNWLGTLPYKHIVIVPGNHDRWVEGNPVLAKQMVQQANPNAHMLINESIVVDGLKIWGSPVSPTFGYGWAYNVDRGPRIKAIWDSIDVDTNILVTHGPPFDILDEVDSGVKVGCVDLANRIEHLKNLKLSVFGHIHESAGSQVINNTCFVNASYVDVSYQKRNRLKVIDI